MESLGSNINNFLNEYNTDLLYVFRFSDDTNYRCFYVAKKNGKKRRIDAPRNILKRLQQKLKILIENHYQFPSFVTAYQKKKSIISNARYHLDKKIVFNVDLKDFFPSITSEKLKRIFYNEPFNLRGAELKIILKLITYKNYLPQGAPTSPVLSNIVCQNLDVKLLQFCNANSFTYSRYADDLTFSTNEDSISEKTISDIDEIISSEGFQINTSKTRIKRKSRRQEVTGIIVNEKLNVRRKYLKNIRAILHNWEIYGYNAAKDKLTAGLNVNRSTLEKFLMGKIQYVGMVRGWDDKYYYSFKSKFNELLLRDNVLG